MDKKTGIEVVGAIGVIASLIFVGVQVRQSAEATRAATVLQLKENWSQFNLTMLENPEIVDALDNVLDDGFENAERRSQLIVEAWWRTMLHNWSNAYYQYRIGTLDPEQWQALLRDIECEARYSRDGGPRPPLWDVWDINSYMFDDSFRTLIDSVRVASSDGSFSCRSGR